MRTSSSRRLTLLGAACLVCCQFQIPCARADAFGYNAIQDLRAQGHDFIVEHHHDWSESTYSNRFVMITTHQDPFTKENDYAYIAWRSRTGGKLVRKLPCPALTWLTVTSDSRFVIGLSNLMLDNPYQLVVYDATGNLLAKRHIASNVACLSPVEHRELLGQYKKEFSFLK